MIGKKQNRNTKLLNTIDALHPSLFSGKSLINDLLCLVRITGYAECHIISLLYNHSVVHTVVLLRNICLKGITLVL